MRSSGAGRNPLDRWPDFTGAVRARLDKGQAEYGGASFQRPPEELVDEIAEELEDVAGWAFVLWVRIYKLRERLRPAVRDPDA